MIASASVPDVTPPAADEAPRKAKRQYQEFVEGAPNAHRYWYRARNSIDGPLWGPIHIVINYLIVYGAKHLPSLTVKRWVFRTFLGMSLGRNVTFASGVTVDYFFPELIEIGDNTIVGMDAMILTHEYLHDRWRKGPVRIGQGVLVGAQSLIMAGVSIGDGARVSARSVVWQPVPEGALVAGNLARTLRMNP